MRRPRQQLLLRLTQLQQRRRRQRRRRRQTRELLERNGERVAVVVVVVLRWLEASTARLKAVWRHVFHRCMSFALLPVVLRAPFVC